MNYVCVILAAVALFAVGYWYAAGRYYYTGPRVKVHVVQGHGGEPQLLGNEDSKSASGS
jgi:hypothetical protein